MGKEEDRGICLSFLYALIDLLYPRLCVVCRKCLTRGEHFLCTYCLCDFPFSDVNFPPAGSCRPDLRRVVGPTKFILFSIITNSAIIKIWFMP